MVCNSESNKLTADLEDAAINWRIRFVEGVCGELRAFGAGEISRSAAKTRMVARTEFRPKMSFAPGVSECQNLISEGSD